MYNVLRCLFLGCLVTGILISCKTSHQANKIPETEQKPTVFNVTGHVYRPAIVSATDQHIAQLKVPSGFTVSKFADQLGKPRIIVVSPAGKVYYSDREAGTITMLSDNNNDGVADAKQTVATIPQTHGLAIYNGSMYIITVRELYKAAIQPDGTLGQPAMLLNSLPDGGQHPNRTIAFGPDGKLYITVGSTCNACDEPNKMNATILQANADGSGIRIYAKGLRNTIGMAWHPTTGDLWGMDHGIDWLGNDEQQEELNKIVANSHYGWPYIYGNGKYNPGDPPPGDTTYQQYLQLSTLPSLTYQAHAAPMQLMFYTGSRFPASYHNSAFITMRGSWNRNKPVGYKVVKLNFADGQPTSFEDFFTGFLVDNNTATFGRLVGLAMHTDGSLLVGDDTNGVIYRINYP